MEGILALALALGGMAMGGDTLVEVRPGDRLVLTGFTGGVVVEGWERPSMSLAAESDESVAFRVERAGSRLTLTVQDRKSRNRAEDLRIALPRWMAVEISGRELDVEVRGLEGSVQLRTLEGDLVLRDLAGEVRASSVEGEIDARGLTGSAYLRTGGDDIRVAGATGPLEVEAVDGDLELVDVQSDRIAARTTDGDVHFSGLLRSGGVFSFTTHSGDLSLALAEPVNLHVSVLPYEGEFSSDFPVRTRGYRSGEGFEFTVGGGGGRLSLEAFDGDIVIRRAGRIPGGDPFRGP